MVSVLRTLRHLGAAMVLLISISLPLAASTHAQEQISDNELVVYTAASIAALTVYDMCKGIDKGMVIRQTRLLEKSGGKSGDWLAGDAEID